MKNGKINHFFKRKVCENVSTSGPAKVSRIDELTTATPKPVEVQSTEEVTTTTPQSVEVQSTEEVTTATPQPVKVLDDFLSSLERDPGKRPPIWTYSPNQVDQIRRAYMKWGPYQIRLKEYPLSGKENHPRRFQDTWFDIFPSWLEYSPSKDAAYCLPCYLFNSRPSGRSRSNALITTGFRGWKRVRDGTNCAFLRHIGKDLRSSHNIAMQTSHDLLKQEADIRNVFQKQSSSQVKKNRLCLKASFDTVRWLTLQACAFRGHDESRKSKNRGNFLELVKLLASYNDEVALAVLDNAPQNAKYSSHKVLKELLSILASRVRKHIRAEIGDSKFCILVDEARDESNKEQMALVLRFVDKFGLIRERFFDVRHVNDTTALTLKNKVCDVLARHNLNVSNLHGQGYDGASNMRGEWNGLQALFMKDCPYAYYVHCFAHRLQLALVTASREIKPVNKFFEKLTYVVNVVCSSPKQNDELQEAQITEIKHLLEIDEIITGKGVNQIGTLKRAGATRWGSHFNSICSLMNMYEATCRVLKKLSKEGANYSTRGDGDSAYNYLKEFDFILILHLMKEIMGITDVLCQALQQKSQDVVNVMGLVRATKTLIQELREDGWDKLFTNVTAYCIRHDIEIPNLDDTHSTTRYGRSRLEENQVTLEHFFKVEIFFAIIDQQLQELNSRFSEQAIDLLTLSCALSPKDKYKSFNIDTICSLVEKYYPMDFNEQEKITLQFQLRQFLVEAIQSTYLKNLSTIQELCSCLVATSKNKIYFLIDRLLRLIMTLPVSTATTERSFSAMKIIKTKLRNKMKGRFLANSMTVYIEREISATISSDSVIDDFKELGSRRVSF